MARLKLQKPTEKQLMETIDSINEISGIDLDQAADMVLKHGKAENKKRELQEIN
ncbi:hypothetical protein [Yeosuana marina]|uniref:hypothetical protein n=1 Tax=Yeosuana marina TaxID=1565536 RepID=UPI0030C86630